MRTENLILSIRIKMARGAKGSRMDGYAYIMKHRLADLRRRI